MEAHQAFATGTAGASGPKPGAGSAGVPAPAGVRRLFAAAVAGAAQDSRMVVMVELLDGQDTRALEGDPRQTAALASLAPAHARASGGAGRRGPRRTGRFADGDLAERGPVPPAAHGRRTGRGRTASAACRPQARPGTGSGVDVARLPAHLDRGPRPPRRTRPVPCRADPARPGGARHRTARIHRRATRRPRRDHRHRFPAGGRASTRAPGGRITQELAGAPRTTAPLPGDHSGGSRAAVDRDGRPPPGPQPLSARTAP